MIKRIGIHTSKFYLNDQNDYNVWQEFTCADVPEIIKERCDFVLIIHCANQAEEDLSSEVLIYFSRNPLNKIILRDKRLMPNFNSNLIPNNALGLSLTDSDLLPQYYGNNICYIDIDFLIRPNGRNTHAIYECAVEGIVKPLTFTAIHEIFHFLSPFRESSSTDSINRIITLELDEFYTEYQVLKYLLAQGKKIDPNALDHKIPKCGSHPPAFLRLFHQMRDKLQDAENRVQYQKDLIAYFLGRNELKIVMYHLGSMRGCREVDPDGFQLAEFLENIWNQFIQYIGANTPNGFHPEFRVFLNDLKKKLVDTPFPLQIEELYENLFPVFDRYILQGLIPQITPSSK